MRSDHPSLLDAAVDPQNRHLAEGVRAVPYSDERFREWLLDWIVSEAMPFTAIEAPFFRRLLRLLKPDVPLPSATSLRRDLDLAYEHAFKRMRSLLHDAPGKLSFTVDGWTSPNMQPFLGITAHWVDSEWRLREALLDFAPLSGSHSGENLAHVFVATCDTFGILPKILAITTDNASANDVFLRHVEKTCADRGIAFSKREGHVRCAAHVLNIAVQELLKQIHAENDEECPSSDSEVGSLGCVRKLRRLITKIRASPQRIEKLARQCDRHDIPKLVALMDVRTRWNSTYKMLQRAETIRAPLSMAAVDDPELRTLTLTENEWGIVAEICRALEAFDEVTDVVSASKHPTLTGTIPMYNALIDTCEDFVEECTGNEMLCRAVNVAREKLRSYYAKANAAVYPIATIIDPRVKMTYYLRERWEDEWVREAKAAIEGALDSYDVSPQHEESRPQEAPKGSRMRAKAFQPQRSRRRNELKEYLDAPAVDDFSEFDVLKWWCVHSGTYPRLSRMARDYLAVPSTSTPAERAFSKGADLVHVKRASLSPETIGSCMCLQSWTQELYSRAQRDGCDVVAGDSASVETTGAP